MAKLINDVHEFGKLKFLTESAEGKKPGRPMYVIEGVAAVAEQLNGNGRSYPYDLLKEEIEKFDKEMIKTGRCLAALEHPDYPEIRPEDACARVLSIKEDNNKTWTARSCILASSEDGKVKGTPKGDLLLSLVQYGTPVGYSTRALGELSEDESRVSELKLCDVDIVLNPSIGIFCDSNGNRFVNGILESKQFVCEFHPKCERAWDGLEKKLSKTPNTFVSEKKAEFLGAAVHEFLESLTK